MSDVFVAALKMLPRYRRGRAPFRAWLYRIASNEVNQWARRERRRLHRERHRAPAAGAAESPAPAPMAETVRSALLSLKSKDQDVLILHHLEGLSVEQIALVLNRPAGTIKSRLHRAREALRRALQAKEPDND